MNAADLQAMVELLVQRPLLTRKDLSRRYGVDLDTIDRWHARGFLPRGYYLPGSRFPYWRPGEILRNEKRNQKLLKRLTLS